MLLRYRPRSQNEIRSRLKQKEASAFIIRKVITYLVEGNYLNDQQFVEDFLATALAEGWGPLKVVFRLKKLGISDSSLLKKAKEESEKQSRELILKLLARKISLLGKESFLNKSSAQAKAVRFLAGRGFYYRDIYSCLDYYLKQNEDR